MANGIGIEGTADGQVLKWNGTIGIWELAVDETGGASIPDGTADGDILKWDETGTQSWAIGIDETGSDPSGWIDNGDRVILENGSDSVGIGITYPIEKLHIIGRQKIEYNGARLLLRSPTFNNNEGVGLTFENNDDALFLGDDAQLIKFRFMSEWTNDRDYDAELRIYGSSVSSWGNYLSLTHDGGDATISTDAGNIILDPDNMVWVEGNMHIQGNLTWSYDTNSVSVSAAAFYRNCESIGCSLADDEASHLYNEAYKVPHIWENMYAPIQIPDVTSVIEIKVVYEDQSTYCCPVIMRLYRNNMDGTVSQMGIVTDVSALVGIDTSSTTTINYGTIDNSHYSYYLQADYVNDHSIYGVIVTYIHVDPNKGKE